MNDLLVMSALAAALAYGESAQGRLTLGYRYSGSPVIDLEPIDLVALNG